MVAGAKFTADTLSYGIPGVGQARMIYDLNTAHKGTGRKLSKKEIAANSVITGALVYGGALSLATLGWAIEARKQYKGK